MSCRLATVSRPACSHTTLRRTGRGVREARVHAGCSLLGVGSSAPSHVITNDDLSKIVDTNDEWINSRTGISRRHVLSPGETLVEHAVASCEEALEMSGVDRKDVDMIIMATSSPDDLFGSASQVQSALGIKQAVSFDVTAACSGFVVGLITAAQFLQTGSKKNVLVIGADALSRYVDWNDRGTCILFGDGAGAALLSANKEEPNGLLGFDMRSDGTGFCHLNASVDENQSGKAIDTQKHSEFSHFKNIHMNGQDVFKFAVRAVPQTLKASLENASMEISQVDWLVMHQANKRILDSAAKKLGIASDKVVSNLSEYGNTSAGSIPLALSEAVKSGDIKDGQIIAFAGFGAGLTWASAIFRWR